MENRTNKTSTVKIAIVMPERKFKILILRVVLRKTNRCNYIPEEFFS
jgi:hypothetical protein